MRGSTGKLFVLIAGLILLIQLPSCSKNNLPSNPLIYTDSGEELPATQLAIPTDLEILDVGDTFLQLAWSDTTGQLPAILVEGRLASQTEYSLWTVLNPGTSEWDAEVHPDSTYVFRIAARNGDGHSPWTEAVTGTALSFGYWDVVGGVNNKAPGYKSIFFRFGRANRFNPPGTLTISGPEGWNGGRVFNQSWGTRYIGMNSGGAITGEYHLIFETSTRHFESTVFIDATKVLPLPEVHHEILPGRRVQVSYSCEGASSYGFCWGPAGAAICVSAGTTTDTLLVALENDPVYWLDLMAFTDDIGGQPSSSSRFFEIDFGE